VYRGGTSRGIFFHDKDLPRDEGMRKHIFLHGIDAWNLSQVDGLGAGTSHTAKCVVIAPPSTPGAHADYTFVQVGIGRQVADAKGTCGNLMSAAAAFAVDEGLIPLNEGQEEVAVKLYDTNAAKDLIITVPLADGKARSGGEYSMPGIVRAGARVRVEIRNPGGGKTGQTLPFGPVTKLETPQGAFTVSMVDMINPFVFVDATDIGLTGADSFAELSLDAERLAILNAIRDAACVRFGWAKDARDAADNSPAVPKVAIVGRPQAYTATSGAAIDENDVDIVTRALSMSRLHRTFPASGLYCLAGACLLSGTIPAKLCRKPANGPEHELRLGHPDGAAHVRARTAGDGTNVASIGMDRTIRRIMRGMLYLPVVS
jgi:2-methylaconitate cis-trans-isomerase PrpF